MAPPHRPTGCPQWGTGAWHRSGHPLGTWALPALDTPPPLALGCPLGCGEGCFALQEWVRRQQRVFDDGVTQGSGEQMQCPPRAVGQPSPHHTLPAVGWRKQSKALALLLRMHNNAPNLRGSGAGSSPKDQLTTSRSRRISSRVLMGVAIASASTRVVPDTHSTMHQGPTAGGGGTLRGNAHATAHRSQRDHLGADAQRQRTRHSTSLAEGPPPTSHQPLAEGVGRGTSLGLHQGTGSRQQLHPEVTGLPCLRRPRGGG